MVVYRLQSLLAAGLITCLLCGCSSIPKLGKSDLPAEVAQEAEPQATYVVEMNPRFGKKIVYNGQITEPIRVQDALELSGAAKKFSEMSVDLYRRVPNNIPLKLAVEFKKGKKVRYEQDYALHPGDRIVVTPNSESPMDKVLGQVLGGL